MGVKNRVEAKDRLEQLKAELAKEVMWLDGGSSSISDAYRWGRWRQSRVVLIYFCS